MNSSKHNTRKIPRVEDRNLHSVSTWKRHRSAILLFVVALIAAFPYRFSQNIESYPQAGDVSQETVIAPFTYPILKSDSLYNVDRRKAEGMIEPVFRWDSTTVSSSQNMLDTLISLISTLADTTVPDSIHLVSVAAIDPAYSPEEIQAMTDNLNMLKMFRKEIKSAMNKGLLSHVPVQSLKEVEEHREKYDARFKHVITSAKKIVIVSDSEKTLSVPSVVLIPELYENIFKKIDTSPQERILLASALYRIFENKVHPTLVYDASETKIRREKARSDVSNSIRTIPKNVEIVRKHQIVTPVIAENLEALQNLYAEQYSSVITIRTIITQWTTLLLLFILSFILIRLLKDLVPRGIDNVTYFNVVSLIVAVSFLIIRIGALATTSLTPEGTSLDPALIHTAIPMVVGSLLAAALFNKETGFIISILFSVYGGIIGGYDPIIPVGILISGGIISGLAASMRYRRDFISMVFWIAMTNVLIGVTMILINGEISVSIISKVAMFALTNAFATVVFSFLLMPLFEQFFHLTTDMTLMELADMNHPLLKRLAIEAPGTYNHSIMVANLAEAAADAIGADALLCRVVSYYHDIGKLKKPSNFIENQYSKKNVHDRISPSMSVRIITGHVREGLELAEEYHLPQAIKDVIPQHHGDSPIAFFYHKACEEKGENEEVDIRDFSYGGPKPQTRENAIIMIADSVEAASRTMKSTTLKDIREMVKKITWSKISHNQLDECGLDLSDLSEMVNGMMPILEGVFHSRIEYPEEEEKENGEI